MPAALERFKLRHRRTPRVSDVRIDDATPADATTVLGLLERAHLPLDGLVEHLSTTLVARQSGRVVGSAALEVYNDGALLRSVAVDPALRGTGLGHRLTEAATARAIEMGVPALYLLTTTAEQFFPKFGFSRIERQDVPMGVQQSVEFRSACPASAVVMRKDLSGR
jgi:amino-acid N-acetyltransferase